MIQNYRQLVEFVASGTLVEGAVTSYKRSVGTDGKFSYNISGTDWFIKSNGRTEPATEKGSEGRDAVYEVTDTLFGRYIGRS
jgi:hypothetical protein